MDRALDEVIGERQVGGAREKGNRRAPRNNWARDGARKTNGRDDTSIDTDWLHDKFEDDATSRQPIRGSRSRRNPDRFFPEDDLITQNAKLRVDNLHYDLTEDELEGLFNRIAPVLSLSLRYDRAGRSTGTAFVTYASITSARSAIRDFDGANANGQPIRLTLLPTGPSGSTIRETTRGASSGVRNPFDSAIKPGRSLFDRIEEPYGGRNRARSRSPGAPRRTDTRKPAPEGIDRYVPDEKGRLSSRSRSPRRNRGRGRRDDGGGRGRRYNDGTGRRDTHDGVDSRMMVNGRPRKTQEELDREMEDYWSKKSTVPTALPNGAAATSEPITADDDIDMIE